MSPLQKKALSTGDTPIIDIHCHPSLKTWLFPKNHIYDTFNPISRKVSAHLFVTIKKMQRGNVQAAVVAHYLPEFELLTEDYKPLLSVFRKILLNVCNGRDKILVENLSYNLASFDQIKNYINCFENDIIQARMLNYDVDIAIDYKSFIKLLEIKGKIVFLHSIEGAHCLGNHISYDELENSVLYLFDKGVCQITIGHLFPNILVSSQGGIAQSLADKLKYNPRFSCPEKDYNFDKGYNEVFFEKIINKMLDIGIIIDLVHCHENAKNKVYKINTDRKKKGKIQRPLVFSHTGVREIVKMHNPELADIYLNYLPYEEDIKQIKDCGGVLGIIFMNFWLFGQEGDNPIKGEDSINAIPIILDTIEFIKNVKDSNGNCGTYDHIAIGTDLDGFTEVPPDLLGEDQIQNLIPAMKNHGISQLDIKKICSGNYMRVLKKGWGNNR